MTRGHFVPLSVSYYDDDRVIDAGHVGETLFTRSLALAGRLWESDGFLSCRQVERLAQDLPGDPIADLVRVGLFRPDDSDPYRPGFHVRSWLGWNRSAAEILRGREKDAARKRTSRSGDIRKDAEKGSGWSPAGVHTDASDVSGGIRAPEAEAEAVAVPETEAAAASAPLRPLISVEQEHALGALRAAIRAAGLSVSWKLDENEVARVVAALERAGQKALVDHARRRHNANSPAFSVKAWLSEWDELEPLRLVDATPECRLHPSAGRRPDGECGSCWTDRHVRDDEAETS